MAHCRCGKQGYHSRQSAKAARQRLNYPSEQRVYRCKVMPDYWHIGELYASVIAGERTRDEVYSMDEQQRMARMLVTMRAHHLCEVCGGRGYEYSHRQTRGVQAHRWCPCNAVWSCRTCHAGMHDSPVTARSQGLHVSQFAPEPSAIPVHLSVGWCLLYCDGGGDVLEDSQVVVEHGIPALVGATQ